MPEVLHFTPPSERNARENLAAFVSLCSENLVTLGSRISFTDNIWDISDVVSLRSRNCRVRIVFSDWATADSRSPVSMREPFLSFAKSYVSYQQGLRPTKGVAQRVAALRALESALIDLGHGAEPTACSPEVLNRAAQVISGRFSHAVACTTATQLEMVAEFMGRMRLVRAPFRWRSPIARPLKGTRVGVQFDELRRSKLPSAAALETLPKIFRLAVEPADVLVSSIAAILCSAPDRINEVLALSVDCEILQRLPGAENEALGLRWFPSKGAKPMIKWVVGSMADVVKEAIGNIRRVTEDARAVARWYEDNPQQIYLAAAQESLRLKPTLSMFELAEVLFREPVALSVPFNWCLTYKVPATKHRGRLRVAFADVERAVVAMIPRGFPVIDGVSGLKYSDALCLTLRNALHAKRATYRCAIRPINTTDIGRRLAKQAPHGAESIFDRFGFNETDGSPIHVTTHQFRHYLNTLAQMGGLSQIDVARWSGRVDVRQNATYDHTSDRDVCAMIEDLKGHSQALTARPKLDSETKPIARSAFEELNVGSAHTTDFGYCVHDFTMTPCQLHSDCLNCEEHVCIKGDGVRETALRRQRHETQLLLDEARIAVHAGDSGACRWVKHQERTLQQLDRLCAILDDPTVAVGAIIGPPASTVSLSSSLAGCVSAMPSNSIPSGRKERST